MSLKTLLWGGRSKARIAEAMLIDQGLCADFIFDPYIDSLEFKSEAEFSNKRADLERFINDATNFIVCIGGEHGYARFKISEYLEKRRNLEPSHIISESAYLDKSSSWGRGVQVMPGSVLHKFCFVGNYSVLNTNATVDHECEIGHGVHIMGGASVAGCVKINDFATIGTNATVLPNIEIGRGAIVGAGAVVTKNVGDNEVVVGVPARHMKQNKLVVDMTLFDNAK